jgi:hypothetical protein
MAVLAALLQNLTGYNFSKHLNGDNDIKTAMHTYFNKVKLYAMASITLRVVFIAGLLIFFCWNVTPVGIEHICMV